MQIKLTKSEMWAASQIRESMSKLAEQTLLLQNKHAEVMRQVQAVNESKAEFEAAVRAAHGHEPTDAPAILTDGEDGSLVLTWRDVDEPESEAKEADDDGQMELFEEKVAAYGDLNED